MHYKMSEICVLGAGRAGDQKRIFMAKFPLNEDRSVRSIEQRRPELGQSFQEYISNVPVKSDVLSKVYKPHSDEQIRRKKADEKKKALESIKKRQEEARSKHEQARHRAQKITAAKQHLRAIGGQMKITDIVALINEEKKDVEEVASSTNIVLKSSKTFKGKKTQKNPRLKNLSSPRSDAGNALSPEVLAKVIQIDHDAKQASTKKDYFKHYTLPSDIAALSIHETPLSAEEMRIDEQPDIDYALLFGDEQEILRYMKNMVESTQRILSKPEMDSFGLEDQLLFDESDIVDVNKYFATAKALEIAKSLKLKMPPQIKVQLRGSQPPRWFPGYYSVLPLTQPANIQLSESASTPLQYAWQETRPDSSNDDAPIVLT